MFANFHPEKLGNLPYLFFTGKGGVGKTSTACATAVSLADSGKKVLIVSTDPASNLQDVFGVELTNVPKVVPEITNLYAINIDPEKVAKEYRERIIGPYKGKLPEAIVQSMEEQLSGACTVEIAAFDEFTNLLTDKTILTSFDHIIFDTAPTGHTLRLLELPTAWSGFLNESTHEASCLGPLSGLNEKKDQYANAVACLSDPLKTVLIFVARPESSAFEEAARASNELQGIGMQNQMLIINGILENKLEGDLISEAFFQRQQATFEKIPLKLKSMTTYSMPLISYSLTGVQNLRNWINRVQDLVVVADLENSLHVPGLQTLIDSLVQKNKGVILTMGKGGVGKTTIASAIAVGLAARGHDVHLTTTDPAAHLSLVFGLEQINDRLTVSRIDPKQEIEAYRQDVIQQVGSTLDADGLAYLEEDMKSPCTEEIAVFRAFANVVDKAENQFVVIDTAPTGHTLLLLDAAKAYHKELERTTSDTSDAVKKLLPRLRNPEETTVALVTLAEATPVLEANRLQNDLRRAGISPKWWVINQSFSTVQTNDPILKGRATAEYPWILKVQNELAENCTLVPWNAEESVGYTRLKSLGEKG